MCDFRIKHWEKAIEKQEKIVDPSPKQLQDLKTNCSLLDYWKKIQEKTSWITRSLINDLP